MLGIIFYVLGYDIWFYISHILLHSRFLWKYHKVHHEIIYPKWTDTYTGHILEGPFQSMGFLVPLLFIEFSLIEFVLSYIFVTVRGMMRHDDRTVWLIGNHHLLHHEYVGCNYGEYWLDWLFGTSIKDRNKVRKGILYA